MEKSKVSENENPAARVPVHQQSEGDVPVRDARLETVRHFAENLTATIIADAMGGFMHVTEQYDALVERMAEYGRSIEVAAYEFENNQPTDKTRRCCIRAANINWYGAPRARLDHR